MDPMTLSLLISGGSALFRGGLAGPQAMRARQLAKKNRPVYEIPQSIRDNQRIAQSAYNQASAYGLPGQSRLENKLAESTAGSLRAVRDSQMSPSAILAGVSSIDKNSRDKIADLGVNAANFRAGEMARTRSALLGANQTLAGYEDRAFNYNKDMPYQAAMRAASALRNSSQNNAMIAIDQAAGGLAGYAARGGFQGGGGTAPSTMNAGQTSYMPYLNPTTGGYGQDYNASFLSNLFAMKQQYPWMPEEQLMQMVRSSGMTSSSTDQGI